MFKRILVNTLRNIRRSPYQAMAAVLLLTITFFVSYIFVLLLLGSQVVLQYFETRPQVTAFFTDEVSENAILNLKQELETQDYVAKVTYVSKDEALTIYREQNKDDPLLLEMVTAEILPASLEVSAMTINDLPTIKTYLEGVSGVEEVIFQQDIVETLTRWTKGIRTVGLVLVSLLIFTSLLVITIIISVKVSAKRQEISTMRLLGASSLFINGPFILEGAIYGLLGAFLAWGLTYISLLYVTPFLVEFLGEVQILPVPFWRMLGLLGVMSGGAAFLGMVSGSFSSRHYSQ